MAVEADGFPGYNSGAHVEDIHNEGNGAWMQYAVECRGLPCLVQNANANKSTGTVVHLSGTGDPYGAAFRSVLEEIQPYNYSGSATVAVQDDINSITTTAGDRCEFYRVGGVAGDYDGCDQLRPIANGGTNQSTLTAHGVLLGEGGSTGIGTAGPGSTAGVPLIAQGSLSDPTFGTAVVAGGGTGLATLTAHNFVLGEGTSAVHFLSCVAGQTVQGAAGDPTCTATPTLGASGTLGSITMGNASTGTLTLEPVTGTLGTVTVSIPALTDTLVNLTGAQTLTNKTLVTASSGNTVTLLNVQGTLSPVQDGGANVLTVIYTATIPGNTMNANSCIRATAFSQHSTGSSSTKYVWAFGPSGGPTTFPASSTNTAVSQENFGVTICNINSTSTQTVSVAPSFALTSNENNVSSGPVSAGAINTANAAIIALEFSVASGTTDYVTPDSWVVELIQ